ncbi:MAG: ABC transporter permease subunit [Candidatus Krumholzibacteria bacterium]|jgi:microcin C transport system permease protein|nr:ABC transporter permease subunit [Candidatus Krumholzibacteria bacterium]MDP6797232.1 ABC transporter permease subunit [Candidatus Krumholzibacteria bacterium]
MTAYFIRRFLLIIPTFLGITILVFTIMQMVPGGPLEQEMLNLQAGLMAGGEGGGGGSGDMVGHIEIPPDALEEMKRFYGFDKPGPVRYLRWLGLWPREMDGVTLKPGKWKKLQKGVKVRALELSEKPGEFELEYDFSKLRKNWQVAEVRETASGEQELVIAWLKFKGSWVRRMEDSLLVNPGEWTALPGNILGRVLSGEGDPSLWPVEIDTAPLEKKWRITSIEQPEESGEPTKVIVAWTRFSGLLTGDLGRSYVYAKPVGEVIRARFPISIYFGLIGFMLSYLVCIPLGVMKAIRHGSRFDALSSAIVLIGYSIPGWALGAVLLVLFGGGSFWDVFPLGEFRSPGWEDFTIWHKITDQVHHTILPVIAYMVGSFATLTVVMKNSLLENLGQDYVRTAFAKGLHERKVVFVHALRNSLIPIATGLGHLLSLILAGSYLIEKVFNIQGFGLLGFTSILKRDYPVVLGILVIGALLRLFGNIFSDILYAVIDPRIRFK